jgi:DHA2 family lincomycin resistance protein-like MFS transporter
MVALAVVGIPVVRDVGEQVEARLDVASVALSAVGLTALVYGISEVTSSLGLAIASMAVGIAFIACFVVRQRRVESPLMNLEPMRKPLFAVACLLVAITMMVTFSMSVLLPLYFEGSLGCDAFLAGLLVLVPILAQALGSLVGGRAMDWQGEWPLLPIGFAVTLAGLVVAALAAPTLSAVPVVAGAVVALAGVGLSMSPSQTAGLRHLTQELNPFGVGIMSTFIQIAAAIGPSLFVGVLSSTFAAYSSAGASNALAEAQGLSAALVIAAGFAAAGLAIAIPYALKARHVPRAQAGEGTSREGAHEGTLVGTTAD